MLRELSQQEISRAIQEALSAAPDDYRVVLEGRHFCGFSPEEIMDLQGWSRPKVDTTTFRARRWLKDYLLEHHGKDARDDWLDST